MIEFLGQTDEFADAFDAGELRVHDADVVGLPDVTWGETVAAVVKPNAPPPSPAELYAYCAERLATYKLPTQWFFVETFPATPTGKVQKFALRDAIATGALIAAPFDKPSHQGKSQT